MELGEKLHETKSGLQMLKCTQKYRMKFDMKMLLSIYSL